MESPNKMLMQHGVEGAQIMQMNELIAAVKELKNSESADPRIDVLAELGTKMHSMLLKDHWLTKYGLDKIAALEERIKQLEEPIFKSKKN